MVAVARVVARARSDGSNPLKAPNVAILRLRSTRGSGASASHVARRRPRLCYAVHAANAQLRAPSDAVLRAVPAQSFAALREAEGRSVGPHLVILAAGQMSGMSVGYTKSTINFASRTPRHGAACVMYMHSSRCRLSRMIGCSLGLASYAAGFVRAPKLRHGAKFGIPKHSFSGPTWTQEG